MTEVDDRQSGTSIAGPVTRAMAAGADAYLTPATLGDLAVEVRGIVEGRDDGVLPSGSNPAHALTAGETED